MQYVDLSTLFLSVFGVFGVRFQHSLQLFPSASPLTFSVVPVLLWTVPQCVHIHTLICTPPPCLRPLSFLSLKRTLLAPVLCLFTWSPDVHTPQVMMVRQFHSIRLFDEIKVQPITTKALLSPQPLTQPGSHYSQADLAFPAFTPFPPLRIPFLLISTCLQVLV